jgi:predicted Zn-dependent protease
MRRVVLAVAALIAVQVAVGAGCAGSSQGGGHHRNLDLGKAMPAELEPGTHHEGDVKVARVRVLADADFRARTPAWKHRITDEIDYANALLTPMMGVRLEITELRDWDHNAPDAPLRETLAALATDAPGDDVHWTIGLTTPSTTPTTAFDELGITEAFGRYLVIRGDDDAAARDAFAKQFPDVPIKDAGDVLDARRRHRQTCVLLHQLGHSLGAIHETDPSWILHATYEPQQSTFSDRNRELMQLALDERLKIKELRSPPALAAQMLAAIEKAEWGGWIAAEKDDEVNMLRAIVDAAKKGETAPDVPAAIYDQFQHAQTLVQQGRAKDALVELDPLMAAYPANAQLRLLACKGQLAVVKGPPGDAARDTCARAAELAQGDPHPYLALAAAYLAAGDKPQTRAQLAQAGAKVDNLPEGKAGVWTEIATMYQQLGDLTHAEDASAHAGASPDPIAPWAARNRTRYGDPRDGARWKITPDNEADYVETVRKILDLVYADKYGEADKLARTADKRWPGAPGIASARCDLAIRQNQDGAAGAACKAALAAFPTDSWALYLSGILLLKQRDPAPGIESLKKAIAADPELAQAWRALAKGLERANATADLAKLRSDYQAAFGQPLQ